MHSFSADAWVTRDECTTGCILSHHFISHTYWSLGLPSVSLMAPQLFEGRVQLCSVVSKWLIQSFVVVSCVNLSQAALIHKESWHTGCAHMCFLIFSIQQLWATRLGVQVYSTKRCVADCLSLQCVEHSKQLRPMLGMVLCVVLIPSR